MSREAAISALMSLVAGAYPWKVPPSRRLKLWGDVPPSSKPCCFLFEGGVETYEWQQSVVPKRVIEVRLFVYIDTKDPHTIGASKLNEIMDAIDVALAPSPGSTQTNLAGTASWARISGNPMKDPGDIDGDGIMIVPVKITL